MQLIHFERHHEPLAPKHHFFLRLSRNFGFAVMMIAGTAAIGFGGFHYFCGLSPSISILNSVKIISGMDPVANLEGFLPHLFEVSFHLFSSLIIIVATSLFLVPVLHRILHRFHLDETGANDAQWSRS